MVSWKGFEMDFAQMQMVLSEPRANAHERAIKAAVDDLFDDLGVTSEDKYRVVQNVEAYTNEYCSKWLWKE